MSNDSPFVLFISLKSSSISCLILFSNDVLPNPKLRNVVKAKVRCSFHTGPDSAAMPDLRNDVKCLYNNLSL